MQIDKESENISKAAASIGESKLPLNDELIAAVENILSEKGYDEAIVFAMQAYLSPDVNAEIVRVLIICRRYNLSPAAAAHLLESFRFKNSLRR